MFNWLCCKLGLHVWVSRYSIHWDENFLMCKHCKKERDADSSATN